MRTVRIDFTADNIFPNGNYVGRIGEHNATQLAITLLPEMLTGVNYHVACFSVGGIPVSSQAITETLNEDGAHRDGNILCIPLWQALTADMSLSLTVEAYAVDGDEITLLAKTVKVHMKLSESVPEVDPESTEGRGMAADVVALKAKSHEHENLETLALIGRSDSGAMTFNGEEFGGDNSGKVDKVTDATVGNIPSFVTGGGIGDSNISATNVSGAVTDRHSHANKSTLDNTTAAYTTAKDSKLSGIAEGAQVNVIESVKYNGAAVAVTNKTVDIAPNLYATPTIVGSTITLENNKEYNISLADDATIALPSAPGTTYSGTILLCLTCTADINLTFDASVKLDSGVSTVTGYHELLITFHPGESEWWVRQTPEVT